MKLVYTFPRLNSHETDIPEECSAVYGDNGVTFHFAENSHSCRASSDIEDFCLRNHKANSIQSLLFVVWVIEARQVWNCPCLKTSTHLAVDACTG